VVEQGAHGQRILSYAVSLPCKAVLFDLDGVLVDSRASVERQWRRWGRANGIDPERIWPVMHGVRSSEVVAALAPSLDAEAEGEALDLAQARDPEGVVAMPGAGALLDSLDLPWTIVTSGRRELAQARLGFAGLPVPMTMVCAEDVSEGKPSPEGYLLAAERLGFEGSECVVVEDAPAGVVAGRAAGARVVGVATTHAAEQLGEADRVVASLEDVDWQGS
jgi:mannitol-1-/sugar-/sorbitol-6-phosphatase